MPALTRSFAPNTRVQAGMASIGAPAVAVLRKLRLEILPDRSSGGSMSFPRYRKSVTLNDYDSTIVKRILVKNAVQAACFCLRWPFRLSHLNLGNGMIQHA